MNVSENNAEMLPDSRMPSRDLEGQSPHSTPFPPESVFSLSPHILNVFVLLISVLQVLINLIPTPIKVYSWVILAPGTGLDVAVSLSIGSLPALPLPLHYAEPLYWDSNRYGCHNRDLKP